MIDYEKKYHDYTQGFLRLIPDISEEYPKCNGFEKCVIAMRKQGWNYEQIQRKLGMPSKKQIRNVLLTWAPETIDNSVKKVILISEYESELYNIIAHVKDKQFVIWGENWTFFIEDKKLKYFDSDNHKCEFGDWDLNCQNQILTEVKEQLNDRL